MTYRWRYEDSTGAEVSGPTETFDDRTEAETFVSDEWADLLESGIDQLTLLCDEEKVYGPMSLHEAG